MAPKGTRELFRGPVYGGWKPLITLLQGFYKVVDNHVEVSIELAFSFNLFN